MDIRLSSDNHFSSKTRFPHRHSSKATVIPKCNTGDASKLSGTLGVCLSTQHYALSTKALSMTFGTQHGVQVISMVRRCTKSCSHGMQYEASLLQSGQGNNHCSALQIGAGESRQRRDPTLCHLGLFWHSGVSWISMLVSHTGLAMARKTQLARMMQSSRRLNQAFSTVLIASLLMK